MNWQIKKVANGFMVMPGYSIARDSFCADTDIYVFKTWQQASAWLNKKFEEGTKC